MTSQQQAAAEPLFTASRVDARADRGRREVSISDAQVTINRRFQGIHMHLALAVSAYRGVALCLRSGAGDAPVYQILLVHSDSEFSVVLDEALDDRNIIADWRLWARVLGLSALVEREIGHYEVAVATPDSCAAESALPRRYRALKQRPVFLARRALRALPDVPVMHAGEREIIARD